MLKEMEYPFDIHYLLSKKKKIKRQLMEDGQE